MKFGKITGISKPIVSAATIIGLTKNWPELLSAKLKRGPFPKVRLRNGVVFESPDEVSLNFLFHEIWVDEFYSGKGYEIKENDIVVDIGGNIGVFALWAATRAEGVRVFSYEPFPRNADFFSKNVESSCLLNVDLIVAAVAACDGERTLRVKGSWMLHSLADLDSEADGIIVKSVSLDTVLADIDCCNFLKIDCEGGEYESLYGASTETMKKIERIICEYNFVDVKDKNGEALADFLGSIGFLIDELRTLDAVSGVIRARRA